MEAPILPMRGITGKAGFANFFRQRNKCWHRPRGRGWPTLKTMNTQTDIENTAGGGCSSHDLLSLGEQRRLISLAKNLEQLEIKRTAIMTKARKIIGFETPEAVIGIDEELQETWQECRDSEMVLVEYAQATRTRWKMEEAVEHMKALMEQLGMKPEDISWG